MQKGEVLHNAPSKRNIGSAKRSEPAEAKSGKPINVVHIYCTFAPINWQLQLFSDVYDPMIVIVKEVFICQ